MRRAHCWPRSKRSSPLHDAKSEPAPIRRGAVSDQLWLGLGCTALAAVIALIWIPMDSGTGLIEVQRRRITLGDALAPTLAAGFIGLGGCVLLLQSLAAKPGEPAARLQRSHLLFLLRFLAICGLGLVLMRWAGPLAVALADPFVAADLNYRSLRDTAPWKYIGYLTGGTFIAAALMAGAEGRWRPRHLALALATSLALALLFDLPLDGLLLPPNGDL
ncbi:hypothetical protein [Phaeobacter sp. J2-8]|uniref:hypothetical protein n=1 Tax=Phaeobacter sp. J2-8 TaxID=2931394 RepID=UPI001FD04E24|nr:hypothetical protein [Phaeobacter sp. J2-8]MCJ7872707.1 hypothetical protein [Phaeobacter sp. J2-8]